MENKLRSNKISLSALLFEKSWNECKNLSFFHKAVCIESDTVQQKCGIAFLHS